MIEQRIPHRAPVLLLDNVTDVVPGERLTAVRRLSKDVRDRLCLSGSTVEDDLFPETLVLESWAQAAALLTCWERPNPAVTNGDVLLAGGLDRVHFVAPVRVDDTIEHRVRLVRAIEDAAILEGETFTHGRLVLRVGKFVMARRPFATAV